MDASGLLAGRGARGAEAQDGPADALVAHGVGAAADHGGHHDDARVKVAYGLPELRVAHPLGAVLPAGRSCVEKLDLDLGVAHGLAREPDDALCRDARQQPEVDGAADVGGQRLAMAPAFVSTSAQSEERGSAVMAGARALKACLMTSVSCVPALCRRAG